MPIRAFVSNSVRTVTEALIPSFEQATGEHVELVIGTAKALMRRIEAGEPADLALLGTATIEELVASGRLAADSMRALASSAVGVGVKAGTPHPKIDTVDAVVQMLLSAESIAHTTEGASGMYFSTVIDSLGLADRLRGKLRTQPGGLIGEVLVAGGAQIGIQQISELSAVPGVEVVGPLPAPIGKSFPNAAGVFVGAQDPAAGKALIDHLTAPAAAAVWKRHGLIPA